MAFSSEQWGLTWDSETRFLALLITLKPVVVPLAASVEEYLALLGHGIVEVALNGSSAGSLVHFKQTRAWKQQREGQWNAPPRVTAPNGDLKTATCPNAGGYGTVNITEGDWSFFLYVGLNAEERRERADGSTWRRQRQHAVNWGEKCKQR